MRHRVSAALILAVMVAGSLMFALPVAGGEAPTRVNNCIHPTSGVSFNELFDVPEQIINPVCSGLTAGEHWRPTSVYTGAAAADAVYPPGYTPRYAAPVDDLLSKLTIKIVVDGGTRTEKTSTFSAAEAMRTDVRLVELNPAAPDLETAFAMPRMSPLSAGHHTYDILWIVSAPHCDGLSTNEAESCWPASGVISAYGVRSLDVAIPEPQ